MTRKRDTHRMAETACPAPFMGGSVGAADLPEAGVTEATQARLPVTQADRDAAGDFMAALRGYKQGLDELAIKEGLNDPHPLVQAFARHRQSHSLPGDVGMRERDRWTLEELLDDIEDEWIDHYLRPDSAERAKCKRCGGDDFDKSSIEHKDGCLVGRIRDARAALAPSPCLGDGVREARTARECAEAASREHGLSFVYAVAETAARIALTPSAPEPVQKLHELPGDVGARAIELLREYMDAEEIDDVDARSSELGACRFSVRAFLDTVPSALSGDAGEGE